MTAEIRFINHACFSIENEEESVIFDPWFFGKVFNDSWSLLRETEKIDYEKIKFIIITHEHPDHLHWPTLKKIIENTSREINVLLPLRKNKNVANNLRKIGFKCAEIPPNKEFKLNNFLSISNYPTGHDSAYVFKVNDKVYLNQNDCQLSRSQCVLIKNKYPKIDFWFMQFSLAGYYANKDDVQGLTEAKSFHKNMIRKYYDYFKPEVVVPFASFIYFCKEHNKFLNDYIININEIIKDLGDLPLQILFYEDHLLYEDYGERNKINNLKWQRVFLGEKPILEHKSKNNEDILKEANELISFVNTKRRNKPEETYFRLYDKKQIFMLDLAGNKAAFVDEDTVPSSKIAGVLHSEDLLFFLKFPWGADTLNITSCFEVKSPRLWRQILIFKDQLYERF